MSGRDKASSRMHAASDGLRSMNRAFSNPTSAHDYYDDYTALSMCAPAVIGTGRWTIQPAMLSNSRLLEAQLDVTLILYSPFGEQ
jgi:hypothetical protein